MPMRTLPSFVASLTTSSKVFPKPGGLANARATNKNRPIAVIANTERRWRFIAVMLIFALRTSQLEKPFGIDHLWMVISVGKLSDRGGNVNQVWGDKLCTLTC